VRYEPTFVEMFSGIGGFRLGLARAGWRCVWANDWDRYANQVYRRHFGGGELVEGDVKAIRADSLPNHTLLTAGFPCQAFSVAGRGEGFEDARGTLFFDIARVAEAKRPPLLLLENVRGLLSNKRGETFATVLRILGDLGYRVEWQVLNSKHFGVPQNRERVFIVGHLRGAGTREIFPIGEPDEVPTEDARGGQGVTSCLVASYWKGARRQRTFVMEEPKLIQVGPKLIQVGTIGKDSEATRVYDPRGIARTVKFGGGRGAKTGLYAIRPFPLRFLNRNQRRFPSDVAMSVDPTCSTGIRQGVRIRRLTPTECERLQGFPDGWTAEGLTEGGETVKISDTQRYKLLGNAVTVNVVEFLGRRLMEVIQ